MVRGVVAAGMAHTMKLAERLYRLLVRLTSALQFPFLLAVRLYWGWQFIETGWGHLTHLDRVSGYFGELGIPLHMPMSLAISLLEFFGGMLLALGLASRLTALLLTCTMLVAFFAADRAALFSIFSDPDKFYAAAPFPFLGASLLVLIFGPGRYSADSVIAPRFEARATGSRAG
jgi:putative oxidoreductase